jgi:ParB/RepB/Spo0J family partition protein
MYQKIEMSKIIPNPNNARKTFSGIERLAKSIASVGLQQPIIVCPDEEEGKYFIVAGERRYKACLQLKCSDIDCKVINRNPETTEIVGLVENVERQNLSVKEKAAKILELRTCSHWSNRALAKEVGVSEAYIRKLLKLENLSSEVKQKVKNKEISQNAALKMDGKNQTLSPINDGEMISPNASEHISASHQDMSPNVAVPANHTANEEIRVPALKEFEKLIEQIADLSQQLNVDDAFIQSLSGKHLRQFNDLLGDSVQRIDDIHNRLQDETNKREYLRRGIPEASMTAQQDSLSAA